MVMVMMMMVVMMLMMVVVEEIIFLDQAFNIGKLLNIARDIDSHKKINTSWDAIFTYLDAHLGEESLELMRPKVHPLMARVVLQVVTRGVNMLDLDVAVMFVVIICFDLQVKIPVMNITDHITKPAITITRALHNTNDIVRPKLSFLTVYV
ncbi:hypothetical protein Tco_1087978 [Tanacetum coccineum]